MPNSELGQIGNKKDNLIRKPCNLLVLPLTFLLQM